MREIESLQRTWKRQLKINDTDPIDSLVRDQFIDPRGYGNAQVRAFQLARDSGRMAIVPIVIP